MEPTPLRVQPVKLRDSLYLLIPVDIARLVGVVSSSSFRLRLDEDKKTIRLVYEMKKEGEVSSEREEPEG
ncbi:MAG TPA: hypothetical protein VE177_03770 [Candidatus Binatus sp.]|nr:hypothetical protein [Candidatus Binatus sp.]